jgi:hypothetical protein
VQNSAGEPVDYGYGLVVNLRVPAAQLYEPTYQPSYSL